jgi:hypothetical protein
VYGANPTETVQITVQIRFKYVQYTVQILYMYDINSVQIRCAHATRVVALADLDGLDLLRYIICLPLLLPVQASWSDHADGVVIDVRPHGAVVLTVAVGIKESDHELF